MKRKTEIMMASDEAIAQYVDVLKRIRIHELREEVLDLLRWRWWDLVTRQTEDPDYTERP